MAGMTAYIARMIRDGTMTVPECAARLGITRGQPEDRLHLMEQQGYIARQKETPAEVKSGCSCGHCVASCSRIAVAPAPSAFILTGKGERLARDADSS